MTQPTTARVQAERWLEVRRGGRSGPATQRTEEAAGERELHALLADLRAAQRRAAAAADAERERIESNLHDGAQQRLVAIRLELGLLTETVEQDPRAARVALERLRAEIGDALQELRELAHGLCPPLLISDGPAVALDAVARRATIPVRLRIGRIPRLAGPIESAAYFCCVEALQNVTKHAGVGARATISLTVRGGALRLRVSDDGVGFDVDRVTEGRGLTSFRDRLQGLGGAAEIDSAPGHGTTLRGSIPLVG